VGLVEPGEDCTDALFVRSPSDAPDVVLGDGSEWDAVAREYAIPGHGTAHARVPEGAVEIEHDRVDHGLPGLTRVIGAA
jgi:hypothetical protein